MSLPYALLAAAIGGLAVHELAHYVACRAAGAPGRLTYHCPGLIPTPAISTDLLAHTPWSWRVTCLAPLVVLVPSLGVASVLFMPPAPGSETAAVAWALWCVALIPSPTDWQGAYYAAEIDDLRAVATGAHPGHQSAEGIV